MLGPGEVKYNFSVNLLKKYHFFYNYCKLGVMYVYTNTSNSVALQHFHRTYRLMATWKLPYIKLDIIRVGDLGFTYVVIVM